MLQEIFKAFGHEVPVVVIAKTDLDACLVNNPYLKEKDLDTKKLYVAFTSIELRIDAIDDLKMSQVKPDQAHIDGNRIYIKYAIGAGKTAFSRTIAWPATIEPRPILATSMTTA